MHTGQMEGFTLALDRFFAACGANGECPLSGGQGSESVLKARHSAKDSVEATPIPVYDGRELRGGDFMAATNVALSGHSWGWYALGLADARDGDASLLMDLADAAAGRAKDGTYNKGDEPIIIISCVDRFGAGRRSKETLRRSSRRPPSSGPSSATTDASSRCATTGTSRPRRSRSTPPRRRRCSSPAARSTRRPHRRGRRSSWPPSTTGHSSWRAAMTATSP